MRTMSDTRPVVAYDPFGEPVADGIVPACASDPGDRAARRIGGAVFWGLALAILAGRIYAYDMPVVSSVASYAAQAIALR